MKKSDLHLGDQIHFRRMNNKAVELAGEIVKIHDDPAQCVDVEVDGTGGIETAHVDDITFGDNKQKKDRLAIGDRVKFLRMNNKAVEFRGTIVTMHPAGVPCVDIKIDGAEGRVETAHVNDVVLLEGEKPAAGGDWKSY